MFQLSRGKETGSEQLGGKELVKSGLESGSQSILDSRWQLLFFLLPPRRRLRERSETLSQKCSSNDYTSPAIGTSWSVWSKSWWTHLVMVHTLGNDG